MRVTLLHHGEDLDRLLDAGHAALVEQVTVLLRRHGWDVVPEATFSISGERGSIDVLAFHPQTGVLLIVEVKSAIPDVQTTLSGLDRKVRLGSRVARERGWRVTSVSNWLVVPDTSTTRRRIDQHEATFASVLPARTVAVRQWAAAPNGPLSGILFLPASTHTGARHRIPRQTGRIGTT